MSIDLNELKDEAEKLNRLLEGPVMPGMKFGSGWYRTLLSCLEKISSIYLFGKLNTEVEAEIKETPPEGVPVLVWDGRDWSVKCWYANSGRWVDNVEYDWGLLKKEAKLWIPLPRIEEEKNYKLTARGWDCAKEKAK